MQLCLANMCMKAVLVFSVQIKTSKPTAPIKAVGVVSMLQNIMYAAQPTLRNPPATAPIPRLPGACLQLRSQHLQLIACVQRQ
jgi:hypothetical protein